MRSTSLARNLLVACLLATTSALAAPPMPDLGGTDLQDTDLQLYAETLEFLPERPLTDAERTAVWTGLVTSVRTEPPQKRASDLKIFREMFRQVQAARGQSYAAALRPLQRRRQQHLGVALRAPSPELNQPS